MAARDDFELELGHTPLAEQTLEDVILTGEDDADKTKPAILISIREFPLWLHQTLQRNSK